MIDSFTVGGEVFCGYCCLLVVVLVVVIVDGEVLVICSDGIMVVLVGYCLWLVVV